MFSSARTQEFTREHNSKSKSNFAIGTQVNAPGMQIYACGAGGPRKL